MQDAEAQKLPRNDQHLLGAFDGRFYRGNALTVEVDDDDANGGNGNR